MIWFDTDKALLIERAWWLVEPSTEIIRLCSSGRIMLPLVAGDAWRWLVKVRTRFQVGDLIQYPSGKKAIVVKGLYHKREWGNSGHPEDVAIVPRVDIRCIESGKKHSVQFSYISRYCEVVSSSEC